MKKKYFYLIVLNLICLSNAKAQTLRDVSGNVIYTKSYPNDLIGSTFLLDNWAKGIITFNDNYISKPIELKYELLEDFIIYKDEKGNILQLIEPIKEFKLFTSTNVPNTELLFRAGFNQFSDYTNKTFYQVLNDGKIKLLKKTIKFIIEEKEYNSSVATRRIDSKIFYFITKENTPILINKNQKDILAKIGEKVTELTEFSKENKLDFKKEDDISKLINYYNTLN